MESNLMSKGDILKKIEEIQKQLSHKQFNKTLQIGIFFLVVCIFMIIPINWIMLSSGLR